LLSHRPHHGLTGLVVDLTMPIYGLDVPVFRDDACEKRLPRPDRAARARAQNSYRAQMRSVSVADVLRQSIPL
jgi:hypothetical protein